MMTNHTDGSSPESGEGSDLDDGTDQQLHQHFATAAAGFREPAQPSISILAPAVSDRRRWLAPLGIAGALIAAATATVLVLSHTQPSSGPAVAPGPGVATSVSGSTASPTAPTSTAPTSTAPSTAVPSSTGPAQRITFNGNEYQLGNAVPWYAAMSIGRTIAVTGPQIRGACNDEIYRLFATRQAGTLVLTSYQYNPINPKPAGTCARVALPPYVAAVTVDFDPQVSVLDASPSPRPLTQVLVPTAIPAGFVFQQPNQEFPQMTDPDRPTFPAGPGLDVGSVVQTYSAGTRNFTVVQGENIGDSGTTTLDTATVGPYSATIFTRGVSTEHCLRWKDKAAGKMEVCGNITGGADALLAVARSIYPRVPSTSAPTGTASSVNAAPASSTASAPGSTAPPSNTAASADPTTPAARITVSGKEYKLVGAVPWFYALHSGRTVRVSTGPAVRGACDDQIYRLAASRQNGHVVLTCYQYTPSVVPQEDPGCILVGLSPYIATVELAFDPPSEISDGARSTEQLRPLVPLMVPMRMPTN